MCDDVVLRGTFKYFIAIQEISAFPYIIVIVSIQASFVLVAFSFFLYTFFCIPVRKHQQLGLFILMNNRIISSIPYTVK